MKYALFFALLPSLAQADAYCDELWFTRNLIFDRAGYCFGSALGQAVFDNSDCHTKSPSLSAEDKRDVAAVKEVESFAECKVDTSRTWLDFTGGDWLRTLATLPIRSEGESACIGYTGAEVPLYAGASANSAIVGAIIPGDDLLYGHLPVGSWEYVTIGQSRAGWTNADPFTKQLCTSYAG